MIFKWRFFQTKVVLLILAATLFQQIRSDEAVVNNTESNQSSNDLNKIFELYKDDKNQNKPLDDSENQNVPLLISRLDALDNSSNGNAIEKKDDQKSNNQEAINEKPADKGNQTPENSSKNEEDKKDSDLEDDSDSQTNEQSFSLPAHFRGARPAMPSS